MSYAPIHTSCFVGGGGAGGPLSFFCATPGMGRADFFL